MIRSPSGYAVSVRKPDGEIVVKFFPYRTRLKDFPFRLPIIRGLVAVYELLIIALSALNYSSEMLGEKKDPISIPIAIVLGLLLFIGLPYYLTVLVGIGRSDPSFHLVDGIFKAVVIIGYLLIIRIFKDVRRIFSLHGAEHVVVNSYEQDRKTDSTFHSRCGTNLILLIVIVSVLVFSISGAGLFLRFLLLPIIFSLSYELFLLLNHLHLIPSFLQHLTTLPPSEEEIRIAQAALKSVLEHEVG